jgi:hypothetical protein
MAHWRWSDYQRFIFTIYMKIILTCSACGHQEWGTDEGQLMNKIKMWNHAKRLHPGRVHEVINLSVPKQQFGQLLQSA